MNSLKDMLKQIQNKFKTTSKRSGIAVRATDFEDEEYEEDEWDEDDEEDPPYDELEPSGEI